MKNYMHTSCRSNYGVTGHPTEKPVQLMELFVRSSSNEGEIVLDPFMGSGTTGMACLQLNRKFIGIEKEQKWYVIAKQRLAKFKKEIEGKQGDGLLV
jgi:DNA modification methylase